MRLLILKTRVLFKMPQQYVYICFSIICFLFLSLWDLIIVSIFVYGNMQASPMSFGNRQIYIEEKRSSSSSSRGSEYTVCSHCLLMPRIGIHLVQFFICYFLSRKRWQRKGISE
jgi:hypothetical protein